MIYYAGIGSRETPIEVLEIMRQMGSHLAKNGATLRSGGAGGADKAFEEGCDNAKGLKEIYIPWKGFEDSTSNLIVGPEGSQAYLIAEKYHPYWHNLKNGARKLQARNSHQILGEDLNTPCQFVVCYTKGGKRAGGTGQALRLATDYNIPIFDCGFYKEDYDTLKKEYRAFLHALYEKHNK